MMDKGKIFDIYDFLDDQGKQKPTVFKILPTIIGSFSISKERVFKPDKSEMKFLKMPLPTKFLLKEMSVEDETRADNLDNMLDFIKNNQNLMFKRSASGTLQLNADIITQREVLQTLIFSLYNTTNWKILGTKYLDTVYLYLANSTYVEPSAADQQQTLHMMDARLKRILFIDSPDDKPQHNPNAGEFHAVIQCKIAGVTVVYNSAMSGNCSGLKKYVKSKHKDKKFAECKVILPDLKWKQRETEPGSMQGLEWWSECMLKGVDNIYVACPDISGNVDGLKSHSLSTMASAYIENWEFELDLYKNFLVHALQKIRNAIELKKSNTVYQFDFDATKGELHFTKVDGKQSTLLKDCHRSFLADLCAKCDD